MYRTIIRSEYLLSGKLIAVYIAMVVLVSVIYPMLVPEIGMTYALITVYLAFIPAGFLGRQSKFRADSAVCSLPISRSQIVIGKYLFSYALIGVEFVVFLLILAVLPFTSFTAAEVFDPTRMVNAVFAITLVCAFLMPLIMRYGFAGIMVFLLVVNVLTVALFALTAVGAINNVLEFLFEGIPGYLRDVRARFGAPGYHLAMLAVSAVAICLSALVSIGVYARRDF